jgi:chromosome segregation ATPase
LEYRLFNLLKSQKSINISTLEAVADINDQVMSALRDMVGLINSKDIIIKNLEGQIQNMSKDNYEYKNSELIKERDSLKINVQNLAKKVEDHDALIVNVHAAYKKEIERLTVNWITTDKLHIAKKIVIDSLHKERLELKSEVHTAKTQLHKLTTINLELANEDSILEKETNLRLTSERNILATKNKNLNDNYSTIINTNNEIHKELDDKKLTIEKLTISSTKSMAEIKQLSANCIVLKALNSNKAETINKLNLEKQALSDDHVSITNRNTELCDNIKNMKLNIKELQYKIKSGCSDTICTNSRIQNDKQHIETIKSMSNEYNAMSIRKSVLEDKIRGLETKKQAEIDELTKEISQLTKKRLETIKQSTYHRLLHEKCAASNQFLQEDYDILEEHSTKLENEIKDLKAKLANITSLLD